MTAAARGNKRLETAVAVYKKLTWSERRRLIAEEREKARRDKAAMLHYAWNEGREKGEAIGEARGQEKGLALGRLEGEAIGETRGQERGLALGRLEGETQGRMKLAALIKSGKTLDEALEILQAEAGNGGSSQGK